VLLAAIGPGAAASNKKSEKFFTDGRTAEAAGDFDKALDLYQKAADADPKDTSYLLAMRRVRFQAGQYHVDQGQKLRKAGKLAEAIAEFQKAFAIDPSSAIAEQELKRTNEIIEREEKRKADPSGQAATPGERNLTPAEAAKRESERRAASILAVPELKPISRQLTGLKIVNQSPKVLYETVGKLCGINILFDGEFQDQNKKYTIDLSNTSLDEALDYLSLLTKTFWKPLSPNAIFITNDNVTKRRDYEEHVTRIFYMQNSTSAQELQEVMTAMRAVTDVRKVFAVNSQSAIVVRGTVDQIALAEKVLSDLDKPKPEVLVDVIVMEANRNKTKDLAFTLVSGGKNGLSLPLNFTFGSSSGTSSSGSTGSTTTTTTGNGVPLGLLGQIGANNWSVVLPGFLLQALMSDSTTRILTTPQVRATDGQKASLKLGDRYPYATGSFQPGVGAVGVSPLVSTQFQFADVGVNVDVTPRIHGGEDVSMQVELEISTIRDRIDVGGLSQPVIGQRKVSHIVRVKEGEITLIGGLMQGMQSRTRSGTPGLMHIPGFGKLFSGGNTTDNNSDLLVALIPHVVRSPDIQPSNIRTIASGTDSIWKISYAPPPETGKPAQPAAAPAPPTFGAPPAALPAKPAGPGLTVLPGAPGAPTLPPAAQTEAVPPVGAPPPPQQNVPATPPAEEPPSGPLGLTWRVPTPQVAPNSTVSVSLEIANAQDLFQAPLKLAYDPKVLRLVEITAGDFLKRDGQQVIFSESKSPETGEAVVLMNRLPGSKGMSGSGTLLNVKFQALAAGISQVRLTEVVLRDSKLGDMQTSPPSTMISVK
jgi:general secretion pathway protein D